MSNKKKYIVRHLIVVTAALFMFCFPGLFGEGIFSEKVCGDIIVEPTGDFYQKHRYQCQVDDRKYIVKEPGASVFIEPDGEKAGYYEGGTKIHSTAIYNGDGSVISPEGNVPGKWICFNSPDGEYWIQWGDCDLKYDHISFMEEHGDEVVDKDELVDSETVVFYTYPRSGEIVYIINLSEEPDWMDKISVGRQYTDPDGKRWGYISYYYGIRNVWVDLDDPANADEKKELNEDSETAHTNQDGMEQDTKDDGFKYVVLISLAAVVAVTIGILEYHRRKRGGM